MSKFIANSFQVPNAFIDEMLDKISGNACKIYLLIVRKTRGWNKTADKISYSQIQKFTGVNSRTTISKALDELLDLGLIVMQNGNEKSSNEYRLNDGFASPKNGLDKNCTSPKNEPASPKNGHTEIHIFKNTNTKNKSEYDTHTHENQDFENSKNPNSEQTQSVDNGILENKKSKTNKSSRGIQKPAELDNQIWQDFLKIKKQRTESDLTITAWNRFFNQILLAQKQTNQSLNEIFEFWISDVNWKGFNSEWYLNRLNQSFDNHNKDNNQNRKDDFRDPKWDMVFGDNFYGNNQAIGE